MIRYIARQGSVHDNENREQNDPMAQLLKLDEAASKLAKQLGANCRQRRAALTLTQAELSERTGIAASHLSHIERGQANPTLEILEQLAKGLETSVVELLTNA